MNARFPKAEHLCSRRLIDRLYAKGHRLMAFPFSVQWHAEPGLPVPCQVLIVAPKRRLHHAVDRNRVKRLTRECYRLNKSLLLPFLDARGLRITLSLVYVHNQLLDFGQMQHKMQKLLPLLVADIASHEENPTPADAAAE